MWVARYAGIAVIGSRNPLGAVANAGITRIPLQLVCSAANVGYPGAAASIFWTWSPAPGIPEALR